MRTLFVPCFLVLTTLSWGQGQQYSITGGSANACAGVIEDSGGPSGEYSDNETYVFTICPDVPGNVIYLTWFVFDLSTAGNNDDNLTIYDGDNTSATSLGTYTGTDLQNLIVSGTVFNVTGCLTLEWHSNNTGTGNFSCGFSCTTPCEHPLAAAVMSEPVPAWTCQGEAVQFNGSGSTAANGFTITEYLWDFDDGTLDSTTGPIISHVFDQPGEHIVQLHLTDDNDCESLNLVDLQILVSTTPTFNGTTGDITTCLGDTVQLTGVVTPITWTGLPDANFGSGVLLPDDVGQPFESSLTFQQFGAGQTVTNTSDIESICVDMEHSFMGDLVLQVICPNGQSMILHQQGGGGTYIGGANDNDGFDPEPGECWHYCWSPDATNGTFFDNSTQGGTPNTILGGTPPSQALEPGTYEPVQSFNNLVGCPLNGEWTFQSTDLWAADNGFICSWEINFNPTIIPDVTTFTPTFGADADSSYWSGPNIISTSANADTIRVHPVTPGSYDYVYTAIDNFGCTYDTTITVTINPPIFIDAGPDAVICNDPVQLGATIQGGNVNCVWQLQLESQFGDGWGGASVTVNINGASQNYTMNGGLIITSNIPVQAGDVITISYTGSFNDWENSYTLLDDQGNEIFSDGPSPSAGVVWNGQATCDGLPPLTWIWDPATGLSDPNIPDPTAQVVNETTFTLTAYPVGHPACATSDSLTVSLDPGLDPGNDTLAIICMSEPAFQLIDVLGGTPAAGGVWTDGNGNVVSSTTFHPLTDAADTFTYTVTTALGCVGSATLEIQLLPLNDPSCCGLIDAGPDSLICSLSYQLHATIANAGDGIWSGPADCVFSDPLDPMSTVTTNSGGPRMLYWTEDDGATCHLVDSVTITFTVPVELQMALTDVVCFEACDGTATSLVTGGNGAIDHTWSNVPNAGNAVAVDSLCDGAYGLRVADVNGCADSTNFVIHQPPLLLIDAVDHVEPYCHGACDGSITIVDAEAVAYSFDGGTTFVPNSTKADLCTGTYDLVIKNAAGCLGITSITVPEPPEVMADFDYTPFPANINQPRITFNNLSENATHYEWRIDSLWTTTEQIPIYLFDERYPYTYEVCLTAFDNHQCPDTMCHDVVIEDVLFTYFPNAFTPDGNGFNETWGMVYNIPDVSDFELQVFDRWGQVVFASTDPAIQWNGSFQNGGGDVLKTDVYAWRTTFTLSSTHGRREYLGHVTLLH